MSFFTRDAYTSKVTKSRTKNPLRRSSSSPFSSNKRTKPATAAPRRKSAAASTAKDDSDDEVFGEQLESQGLIRSLGTDLSLRDVPQMMKYIQGRMFADIPERGAGMSSTRVSEVLNYRKNLPPIILIAHVHALSSSPTATEREIAELGRAGVVRKMVIPGRGMGNAAVGEGLVLVEEWERLLQEDHGLDKGLKDKYKRLLRSNPTIMSIPGSSFTTSEISSLTGAGFLTSSVGAVTAAERFLRPGATPMGPLSSIAAARAAAGSVAAVGGENAIHDSGGGGLGGMNKAATTPGFGEYNFSLPATGPYLKLVVAARDHLLTLLKKSSKFKELPQDLLRDKWDGAVANSEDDAAARARRARGEFIGVLPGKTKKWKTFYGLRFEWVLEECLGAGLVECFQTGSVGMGVRAV